MQMDFDFTLKLVPFVPDTLSSLSPADRAVLGTVRAGELSLPLLGSSSAFPSDFGLHFRPRRQDGDGPSDKETGDAERSQHKGSPFVGQVIRLGLRSRR